MQNPICAERNITGKGYPASLPVIPYSLLYTQLPILQSYTMHLLPWTSCHPNHCPQACFYCFPRDWHRLHVYCLMIIYTQTALCLLVSYNVIQGLSIPSHNTPHIMLYRKVNHTKPYHTMQGNTTPYIMLYRDEDHTPSQTDCLCNKQPFSIITSHHHHHHHSWAPDQRIILGL